MAVAGRIGRYVLLADGTAFVRIGGIEQIRRLLLCIDEYVSGRGAPATGGAEPPDRTWSVTVTWEDEDLLRRGREALKGVAEGTRGPGGPEIRHRLRDRLGSGPSFGATEEPEGPRTTPVLSTRLVPGRGALGMLIEALARGEPAAAELPLALVAASDDATAVGRADELWDELRARADRVAREDEGIGLEGFATAIGVGSDLDEIERALFASLGKASDGFAARHLNRPISTWLSRRLADTPVHPHHLTATLVLLSLVDAAVLLRGTRAAILVGTILYNLHSVLDGCDGELARARFQESRFGAWFDTLGDQLANHLFVLCLGIGLSRRTGPANPWSAIYLWEGILSALGMAACVWWVSRITRRITGEAHFREFGISLVEGSAAGEPLRSAGRTLVTLLRRDSYAWGFVVLAAFGLGGWILHFLAAGVAGHALVLLYGAVAARIGDRR